MSETTLPDLQNDVGGRLSADSYFSNIPVLIEDKEVIANEIAKRLGPENALAGKAGICALVRMPIGLDDMPDVYFSPLDIDLDVTVIELPTINRDPAIGTLKPALAVARRAYRVLKNYIPGGLAQNLVPQKQCIVPTEEFAPLPAYNVRFTTRESDAANYKRVSTPTIVVVDVGGGFLQATITSLTPANTIYVLLVGGAIPFGHPGPGNANATIYNGPVTFTPGKLVRAAAFVDGILNGNDPTWIESDVAAVQT